jgi:hypothetical protein
MTTSRQLRRFCNVPAWSTCPPIAPGKRTRRHEVGQERTHAVQQAAPYSITSSARASSVGGTVRPSALAVLTLMISSNLVGCSTGRSAGFSPLPPD